MPYLGIEIGGTKLQLAVGHGDGTLLGLWRGTVVPEAGADGIRRQIALAVPELLAQATVNRGDLCGVGIGFGGPVDDRNQTVVKSHQIEGWNDFPLADWLGEMLELRAALGNDADVAGLGEASFGAGKGLSPIFYITIGSGIGGGLIINGEIYRGCGRGAAEIGHLEVLADSDSGGRGRMTVLELVASGWGIQNRARQGLEGALGRESSLARTFAVSSGELTTKDVATAAEAGDTYAQYVLERTWDYLAEAIRQMVVLTCPRRIVIGGGVSLMGESVFFAPLRRAVAKRAFPPFAGLYDIVPAALGEEVVLHGALALARRRFHA
jgi:glucokinase